MKNKLITALRIAANALESGTFAYDWKKHSRCNCGALFCALTGKSADQLDKMIPNYSKRGDWAQVVGIYCPVSGIPTHKLFKALSGFGLSAEDIVNLEYMRDQKVLARMKLPPVIPKQSLWDIIFNRTPNPIPATVFYDDRKHAAAYMRAWADLLTEQGAEDAPASVPSNKQPTTATAP